MANVCCNCGNDAHWHICETCLAVLRKRAEQAEAERDELAALKKNWQEAAVEADAIEAAAQTKDEKIPAGLLRMALFAAIRDGKPVEAEG